MAKIKTKYVCQQCGYETARYMGKCPECGNWETFVEEKVVKQGNNKTVVKKTVTPVSLKSIEKIKISRISSGFDELDRVLGGGFVNGSLTLLGGEPGIGKSTLILQICEKFKTDGKVLYVSGEESAEQIKIRADRLGINSENIMFLGETDINAIEQTIEDMDPKLVIIDSIQTMYSDDIASAPGSVSQVREITSRIMKMCKMKGITTVIIGHVTKDGTIAGPRVLEHMVDAVLYIEGERYFSYRIVRGVKNRFGSTNEIGMFEMRNEGMVEITNPSSVLLTDREDNPAGSVIVASLEGTRPILVELQALTSTTVFGMPRRTANGIDYNRVTLLIAVLEKIGGVNLGNQDVYMNIVGGIKINEPALDLGVILSAASSFKNISIPKDVAVIGEVGLTGEIRSVNMIEKRLKEVEKMGLKKCIIPDSNKKLLKEKFKLDIIGCKDIIDAMKYLKLK